MELTVMLKQLSEGMLVSVEIFLLTLLFSLPLGLMISFGRMSKNPVISFLVKIYIAIMRGTPLMLQLIVVYFAPSIVFGMKISQSYRFTATIIAFSINYAAYFAEIYRSGIESMPIGQYEAAKVLGFNKFQTFFKIILPQVIKRILPPVTNETITLVKDTALVTAISVSELLRAAKGAVNRDLDTTAFLLAALLYLFFTLILTVIFKFTEKRFSRHIRRES